MAQAKDAHCIRYAWVFAPDIPMRSSAALLCLVPLYAAAAADDDIWMSVQLDGRKIGQMHTLREVHGKHVITTQTLDVELERAGTKMKMSTRAIDTETTDGN